MTPLGQPFLHPCPSLPFLTQYQGGNEGRGHAAGTEQEGMWDTEVAVRDPAKDNGCDGRQEAHHRGLHLRRGVVTRRAERVLAEVTEHLKDLFLPSAAPGGRRGWSVQSSQAGMMSLFI